MNRREFLRSCGAAAAACVSTSNSLGASAAGAWIAYNFAHDVRLPGSTGKPVPFLMYPQAETAQGRLDSLDPENFRYDITAHESGGTNEGA